MWAYIINESPEFPQSSKLRFIKRKKQTYQPHTQRLSYKYIQNLNLQEQKPSKQLNVHQLKKLLIKQKKQKFKLVVKKGGKYFTEEDEKEYVRKEKISEARAKINAENRFLKYVYNRQAVKSVDLQDKLPQDKIKNTFQYKNTQSSNFLRSSHSLNYNSSINIFSSNQHQSQNQQAQQPKTKKKSALNYNNVYIISGQHSPYREVIQLSIKQLQNRQMLQKAGYELQKRKHKTYRKNKNKNALSSRCFNQSKMNGLINKDKFDVGMKPFLNTARQKQIQEVNEWVNEYKEQLNSLYVKKQQKQQRQNQEEMTFKNTEKDKSNEKQNTLSNFQGRNNYQIKIRQSYCLKDQDEKRSPLKLSTVLKNENKQSIIHNPSQNFQSTVQFKLKNDQMERIDVAQKSVVQPSQRHTLMPINKSIHLLKAISSYYDKSPTHLKNSSKDSPNRHRSSTESYTKRKRIQSIDRKYNNDQSNQQQNIIIDPDNKSLLFTNERDSRIKSFQKQNKIKSQFEHLPHIQQKNEQNKSLSSRINLQENQFSSLTKQQLMSTLNKSRYQMKKLMCIHIQKRKKQWKRNKSKSLLSQEHYESPEKLKNKITVKNQGQDNQIQQKQNYNSQECQKVQKINKKFSFSMPNLKRLDQVLEQQQLRSQIKFDVVVNGNSNIKPPPTYMLKIQTKYLKNKIRQFGKVINKNKS